MYYDNDWCNEVLSIHEGLSFSIVGHTCHELFALRTGKIGRIPDIVVWPGTCIFSI